MHLGRPYNAQSPPVPFSSYTIFKTSRLVQLIGAAFEVGKEKEYDEYLIKN